MLDFLLMTNSILTISLPLPKVPQSRLLSTKVMDILITLSQLYGLREPLSWIGLVKLLKKFGPKV